MTVRHAAWALPGLVRWLNDIVRRLSHGLAVVPFDQSRPAGVVDALRSHLRLHPVDLHANSGQTPASAVADVFGTAPTLEALLNPVLDQELAIILLAKLEKRDLNGWSMFLERFASARVSGRPGPSLLVIDPPPGLIIPTVALAKDWRTGLRRGDLVIWAEEHLPTTREGLAADVAVALAVELCGWRLDIGASLAQAGLDDLADPINWLSRRPEKPILGTSPLCPLAIFVENRKSELQQRIWKAQLSSLFPALENWRLDLVTKHRNRLRIDEHLRSLGITSVDEIELGALLFQLRRYLNRPDAAQLDTLARARNKLAHRQPVDPEDVLQLLRT